MKLPLKFQIVIIHLWFAITSYLMITEEKEQDYIGKIESNNMQLYELIFYISLFILVLFYVYLVVNWLKKK